MNAGNSTGSPMDEWGAQFAPEPGDRVPGKIFRNFYGSSSGTVTIGGNVSNNVRPLTVAPEWWVIRIKSDGCLAPLLLRREGGDDVGIYLNGPANSPTALAMTGNLAAGEQQLTGTITEPAVNGNYLTGTHGSAGDYDKAEVVSQVNLTLGGQPTQALTIEGTMTGGEQACYGDEVRLILPGQSRTLQLIPPAGNTVTYYYTIAAVSGYNPSEVF